MTVSVEKHSSDSPASRSRLGNDRGSVLVITMILCALMGIMMASYLSMLKTQHLSVARAQAWNTAIVVSEAGVEEAMAQLNTPGVTTNNLAVNSWSSLGGGVYTKSNVLGSSYYLSYIKLRPAVTDAYPVIVATGIVSGPVSGPNLSRAIQVKTKPKPSQSVGGAMIVATTVNFNGQGITTDSFNSTDANYSTGGLYDPTKARDHGDVWTISGNTNSIQVDNGTVKGSVHTAPNGQSTVGSVGVVGDFAYVSNSVNLGTIESGHGLQDGSISLPDNSLPTGKIWLPPVPGSYKINGVTYKYLLGNSNPWKMPVIDGSVYINGSGVQVWVTGDANGNGVALPTKGEIRIPVGKSVDVYMAAQSANVGGNGIINDTGVAKNFRYWGLPSNTSLTFSANAAFVGQINAPEADFKLGGGGSNTYDFIGSSITKSVTMGGHFNFHYDEALNSTPAASGYTAFSWDEVMK
jgi:hypothetical protein